MSDSDLSDQIVRPPLQLVRLPVDKPQPAVDCLHARSQGVMDLIAHFWERLPQTPPLQRADLHLVVATPVNDINININKIDAAKFSGAMLYVPKAHRADVLALDASTAAAFVAYICHQGAKAIRSDNPSTSAENGTANTDSQDSATASNPPGNAAPSSSLALIDLSAIVRGAATASEVPADVGVPVAGGAKGSAANTGNGRVPIDFLSGHADGIGWMIPLLLPVVHRRSPARQLVNIVMQLAPATLCQADPNVRVAKEADVPLLNRWRRQYKEERGILFDADLDAWVQTQRIFVYEHEKQVVTVAKFDLELPHLMEIGGVYTFPEFRNRGFGARIVSDLAWRIRQSGKIPTLQVDEQNLPALRIYESAGWKQMGKLARVWLTG